MRSLTRRLALAAALALVVTAGACSSNNSSNPVSPTPTPTPGGGGGGAADVTITITGMNGAQSFSPSPGTVKAGQTVAWHNGDSITHTATADNGAFDTGGIPPNGTSAAIAMPTAGTIAYHCSIHPSMVGSLTVQ